METKKIMDDVKRLGSQARYLSRLSNQLDEIVEGLSKVISETNNPETVKAAVNFYKKYRLDYIQCFGSIRDLEYEKTIWSNIEEDIA